MDTGNIIGFFKKFSFFRLVWTGIILRIFVSIADAVFDLGIEGIPNFNYYIFAIALGYTLLWMFNKSYIEEDEDEDI